MKFKKLFPYFFVFLIFSSFVLASPLDLILNPFSTLNIAQLYLNYYSFIDAVIYLMLFMGLAQFVFKRIYKEHAKPIVIGVGLSLTIAMTVFELRTGFYIGKLFVLPAIIFLLLLSIFLFQLIKSLFEDTGTAFCLTYMVMYGVLISAFSTVWKWINQNAPVLAAIMSLALAISLVYLIIKLFGMFGGKKKNGNVEEETRTTETEKPKPPEEQVTQTVDVSDVNIKIKELFEEIKKLESFGNDFGKQWNVILTKGHDADENDWVNLYNSNLTVRNCVDGISRMIASIAEMPNFNKINDDEMHAFKTILEIFIKIYLDIEKYDTAARKKFDSLIA